MVDFHRLLFKTYTFLTTAKVSVIERDVMNVVLNNGQVCYDDIGCYRNDHRNPCGNLSVLPYSPDKMDTKFYLYTPEKANSEQIIDYFNPSNMTQLQINISRPLFIVVHGFSQVYWYTNGKFLTPMREALIETGNNVLLVDWVAGADFPNYYQAASNLRVVGAMIGNVISRIEKYGKGAIDQTTIVGWSLGCHAAGFAGKRLTELGTPPKSIVGLDPSRSLFADTPPNCRLDSGDARFVQIIHTNGGDSDVLSNSSPVPTGHADFYVNGGRVQDACLKAASQSKCSHDLSYWYYIESMRSFGPVNTCQFISFPCENEQDWNDGKCSDCGSNGCQIMGYNADPSSRGKFYIDTLPENATVGRYCGTHYTLTVSSIDVIGKGEITIIVGNGEPDDNADQTVIFQSEKETLDPNVNKTRVIVFKYPLSSESRVSLLYRKHVCSSGHNGTDTWTIGNVLLKGPLQNGKPPIRVLENRVISDNEPVELRLDDL